MCQVRFSLKEVANKDEEWEQMHTRRDKLIDRWLWMDASMDNEYRDGRTDTEKQN